VLEELLEGLARYRRQRKEGAIRTEASVRDERVDVRVEIDEISESMDNGDRPRNNVAPVHSRLVELLQ